MQFALLYWQITQFKCDKHNFAPMDDFCVQCNVVGCAQVCRCKLNGWLAVFSHTFCNHSDDNNNNNGWALCICIHHISSSVQSCHCLTNKTVNTRHQLRANNLTGIAENEKKCCYFLIEFLLFIKWKLCFSCVFLSTSENDARRTHLLQESSAVWLPNRDCHGWVNEQIYMNFFSDINLNK